MDTTMKSENWRIRKVKTLAKEYGWHYFLNGNANNFKVVTQDGIVLGREEFHDAINSLVRWYVILKKNIKLYGSYDKIVPLFVADINDFRGNVIYL